MNDEHDAMVADCEARESRLTEWEQGFVQSMRERLDARRAASLAVLSEVRNLIPSVESSDDRDELLGMLEVRAAELTPGAA